MKKKLTDEQYLKHQKELRERLENDKDIPQQHRKEQLEILEEKTKKRKFRWILTSAILLAILALIGAAINIGISNVVSAIIGSIIAAVTFIHSRRDDTFT